MKSIALISALLGLVAGCSTATPTPRAAVNVDSPARSVVQPPVHYQSAAPGSLEMSWTPPAPPPPPVVEARALDAKPSFVSNTKTRGRLFVLPTTREN